MARRPSISDSDEWRALVSHHAEIADTQLRDLFAQDPDRGQRLTLEVGDLLADYSKHRVTDETLRLLVALAERAGLGDRIEAMFAGERINTTEQRAALHVALRTPPEEQILVDGHDVVPDVHAVLDRMSDFAERVRSGSWRGLTGKPIRNVVNIGIGGSDLGPSMASWALRVFADRGLTIRFVSNIDGTEVAEALHDLEPAETLFIVCSKTFTTHETLANALTAREWLLDTLGDKDAVSHHFVAVSTNADEVAAFGIDPDNMFGFWDWVGGRFSLSSAIGLSVMIAIGPDRFYELLEGFHLMDEHFRTAPLEQNLPVIMALLGVWYTNFFDFVTHAVLPYNAYLAQFTDYLQQLEMESNGKSVRLDGERVQWHTAPIVWGQPGTNGQHAFFQLLHQGTRIVPVDFLFMARPHHEITDHHRWLVANCLAQSEALAFGKTREEAEAEGIDPEQLPHRVFDGNRPSTTIIGRQLMPSTLGQLIALYEHKVFVQGVIWDINSFDQWGVELGKALAKRIGPELVEDGPEDLVHDSSTNALIRRYREWHDE